MEQSQEDQTEKILSQLYAHLSPESLDNSKVCSLLNEHLTVKIQDLLALKEISKCVSDKETLLTYLKKMDFIKISEDNETITYDLPEGLTVFSILNFPAKMSKKEVEKSIELDNLQFSRLYKKSLYWILATNDKETTICSQNSLRELIIDDTKIKYDMKNKSQILKMIKEQLDKSSYQKEAKGLGLQKKADKKEVSSNNSDAFSWRKGSGDGRPSFDSYEKPIFRNKNKDFKRNRFNSDNAPSRFQRNQPIKEQEIEEIEIDISNLKYSLNIKYKYSFQDMKQFLAKLKNNNFFKEKPKFLSEAANEIIIDTPKEISVLDELIEKFEKNERKNSDGAIGTQGSSKFEIGDSNIKIPKMNPLCSMPKMFNKFDMVPGNIPQPQWIPPQNEKDK